MYFVYSCSCTVLRANIQNRKKTSVFAYGPASRMYFRHAHSGAYRTAISAAQILVIIQKYKYQQYWAHTTYNGHRSPTSVSEHFQVPTPQEPLQSHAVNLLSTFLQWFYVNKCPTLSTCCICQKASRGRYHALACRTRYCFTNSVRPSVRHIVVLYINE